jgi:hypothetical protein
MAGGELVALAQAAGQAVVSAAATDAWAQVRRGVARLLGRGDPGRVAVAERRLDEACGQLTCLSGDELDAARAALAVAWQARLADLLDDDPGVAEDLRALVAQVRAGSAAGTVSAAGHGTAVGGNMTITAPGGVAAAAIHGDVTAGNPTRPGPAAS